jgi:SH3-like domain-containing protein
MARASARLRRFAFACHGLPMRAIVPGPRFSICFIVVCMAAVLSGPAIAQDAGRAPTSEKPPSHAATEKAAGEHRRGVNEHKPPVISPHRSSKPQKPKSATKAPPAAGPTVPPVGPTTAPAVVAPQASGSSPTDGDKQTGPKLPQFASLRSDDVNMRAGPGTKFRIEWVYKRREMPVEILREYDVWRWVSDSEGTQGWVHTATLTQRRSFIVRHADASMRSSPNDTASIVAILKVGVIGRIRSCDAGSAWCWLQVGSYRGYLRRDQFWGTLPGEAVNP